MKKTVKTTKKTKKPAFIVDMTEDIKSANELYARFGLAKQDANLPMSDVELEAIITVVLDKAWKDIADIISAVPCTEFNIEGDEKIIFDSKGGVRIKKAPWYKRFWRWLTRKKK